MLVITTHSDPLLFHEYVEPVLSIVGEAEIAPSSDPRLGEIALSHGKIIITGTAIRDFEFEKHIKNFSFLREFDGHALGICAGAQIIMSAFRHRKSGNGIIGKSEVAMEKDDALFGKAGETFHAYFEFSRLVESPDFEPVGFAEGMPVLFRRVSGKSTMWASYFHPEVMNREILSKFVSLGNQE